MISNPGGFVEGVTLDNLLVVAPRPRNPLLADAIKRIGLAERTGRGIDLIYQGPVESMIALALLRQERRVDTTRLARQIQRDENAARQVLERLVEAGLVQAHGARKGRTYTLSPKIYQLTGETAAYVRQAGFDPIQQEQMVLQYVRTHGRISRRDAAALCQIGGFQAGRLLKKLVEDKKLVPQGKGRTASYTLP